MANDNIVPPTSPPVDRASKKGQRATRSTTEAAIHPERKMNTTRNSLLKYVIDC